MATYHLLGASAAPPIPRWSPSIGAFLASGIVAYIVGSLPIAHSLYWGPLIGLAAARVLAVWLGSALAVWILCTIHPAMVGLSPRNIVLQTSLDSLWLAPLAILVRERSPWSMVVAFVLVRGVAKTICSFHNPAGSDEADESMPLSLTSTTFAATQTSSWFRRQLWAAVAGLCAQIGALAGFAGYALAAALLVGGSSGLWTHLGARNFSSEKCQRLFDINSTWRIVTVIVLMIVITAGTLTPYLEHTHIFGGFGIASRRHSYHGFSQPQSARQTSQEKSARGWPAAAPDETPGIVLIDEKQMTTKLVAPPPTTGRALLATFGHARPVIIPFDGVYWFFKAPDVRPPGTSRKARGTPDAVDIRSTDRRPLTVEAYDNFGTVIDTDCCRKIQIAIRNADRYPETVSLELVLINTTSPDEPSQSLGSVVVKSTRPWAIYGKRPPTTETLDFLVPPNPSLRRFDEAMIVFRLNSAHADTGPKIAIDRFVLVPRGL